MNKCISKIKNELSFLTQSRRSARWRCRRISPHLVCLGQTEAQTDHFEMFAILLNIEYS